jgi:hypothetical protein
MLLLNLKPLRLVLGKLCGIYVAAHAGNNYLQFMTMPQIVTNKV